MRRKVTALKSKRIISFILAAVMSITAFGVLAYAAPGGEETWSYEQQASGLNTPFRPSDKYVCEQNAPDFLWPHVSSAKKYDLIVCSDSELKDIKYSAYDITNNFYTFPTTFETGVYYYWAVRYFDGKEYSQWSNARRFKIKPGAYEFVYPGADALMAKIPKSHPRIYFTQDTLEDMRSWKDTNADCKRIYDSIISKAHEYVEANYIPKEPVLQRDANDEGKNAAFLQQIVRDARELYGQVTTCGQAYQFTGDKEIGKYGVKCLVELSKWDINGDTSYTSQDQVHRAIALNAAIGYDMLQDLMTESEKKQVISMVVERTKVMEYLLDSLAKSSYDSHGWTAYGFIGIIALALYGDAPEAENWLRTVFDGYTPMLPPWSYEDGGWSQGTDYWRYSSSTNKEIVEVLALAGIIDLNQKAWCRNEYLWMLYAYPPNSYGSFGDQANRTKSSMEYSGNIAGRQLAFDRGNEVLKWLYDQWGGSENMDGIVGYYVAKMVENVNSQEPMTYPLAHEFSDVGWTVMSDDLIDPNRIQCTFKSSYYGSYNHSHPDQNSFIIQAYGENLAIKSGYYDSYHSKHDSGFTRKTGAHNSVTIANSRGQVDDDFNAKGKLTGFLNQIDFDMSAGDATQAYKGELDKFERCMLYIRPDIFVVIDELDAKDKDKRKFEWWLNAEHDIKTYDDGAGARLQEGSAVLDAKVQYPSSGVKTFYNNTFALSDMTIYPATGQYANYNVQRRVWFQTPKVDRTKMIVTMDVHRDGTEARYVDTEEHEDYVKMTFADGTVVLVNTQETGKTVTTDEEISFDGTAVMYNDRSIMLALGTFLKWGDKELIRCEDRASVVMGGNELSISTYTDQKISVDTENEYINGITKVTDYNGNEISKAYGIAMENGMLIPNSKVGSKETIASKTIEKKIRSRWDIGIPATTSAPSENSAKDAVDEIKTTYMVDPSKSGITFDADMDNYTLMLNGKLVSSSKDKGSIKIKIDGEVKESTELTGYMRRDGSFSYNGKLSLDGRKYIVKSINDGLSAGLKVGDVKGITELTISSTKADNVIELETVPVNELAVDQISDHVSVKNAATVFIEAESAEEIGSGNVYNTREFMSGGAGITKHDTAGTNLVYTVNIPEDGDYTLSLDYVAWEEAGARRGVTIDDKVYEITLPKTASWGADSTDWRAAVGKDTIHLNQGTYTLKIEAISGMWNLDWIAFTKK